MKGHLVPYRRLIALPFALAVLGLAACSFEAGPTVSADDLADLAEGALEEQVGVRPDLDCGDDDSIVVTQDKEVECTLSEGGVEYDAVVTFTNVDGREYEISVEVADEAN